MSDVSTPIEFRKPGLAWLSDNGDLVLEIQVDGPGSNDERLFLEYAPGDEMFERVQMVTGPLSADENRELSEQMIAEIFADNA